MDKNTDRKNQIIEEIKREYQRFQIEIAALEKEQEELLTEFNKKIGDL